MADSTDVTVEETVETDETPEVELDDEELEETEDTKEEDEDEEPEFNLKRALRKIQKANSENKNLRAENKRLKEASPAPKDEEPSDEEGPTREQLLAENARYKVLGDQGIPTKYAKFITATEPEQILEQVQELLELSSAGKPAVPNPRPKPKASGGSKPNEVPEETDPRKLAASVPRY